MLTENSRDKQRILIIGAGRGGSAMIDIFIDDHSDGNR
jgi:cell division GTPase FtsZ